MKGAAARAAAVMLVRASVGTACPCDSVPGPLGALTSRDTRWGVIGSLSYLREIGTADASGRAWSSPPGVSTQRGLLDLGAAWRPRTDLELSVGWSAALTATSLPGVSDVGARAGDVTSRVRWEAPVEARGAVPDAAVWAGLRAPTGGIDASGLGAVTGLGLGAWEASLGAALRWRLGTRVSLTTQLEGGLRFAAVGDATPGPRGSASVGVEHRWSERWAWSLAALEVLEASSVQDGQRVPSTATRRTAVLAAVGVRVTDGVRLAVHVAADIPLDGFAQGVVTQLRTGLAVGWSR